MWRRSEQRVAQFVLTFLVAVTACSVTHAQDVRTNYMPGTDFSKYRTYKWVTMGEGGHPDQILDAQIRQSIDSQLAAKGFTKVDTDKPDLLVGYQVAVTKEREWNAYGRGFGFPPFDGGIATSSTINVGTLVLGIYDPAAKQLVWTGSATKTIDDNKDPQKIQKNLNKAMQKLLKDFPPGRK